MQKCKYDFGKNYRAEKYKARIKENLKELKILFNKKGAKTGSEAAQKIKEKYTR